MRESALDREMRKLAAMGVTVSTVLASGVPETDRPATRIRDAARRARLSYSDNPEVRSIEETSPGYLPPRFGRRTCTCHANPNYKHLVACCLPDATVESVEAGITIESESNDSRADR